MLKSITAFLDFLIKQTFFIIKFFDQIIFTYIKMSNIHQLKVTKVIKKDYKRCLVKDRKTISRRKRKKRKYRCEYYKNLL